MAKRRASGGPLGGASVYMVEVRARSWKALCAFYGETLGLRRRMMDGPGRFAMYGEGQPFVAVVGRKASGAGANRVVIDFVVDDLDAALAGLRARGVVPSYGPEASDEGYRLARIEDPEGNEIHLFEWAAGARPA